MSAPMRSRTRSRFPRTRSGAGIEHRQPGLAPGHAVIAAVREVELGTAAGAVVHVLHGFNAGGLELAGYDRSQVEPAAVGNAVEAGECRQHLLAHLVATAAYSGPDRRRGRVRKALESALQDAFGEAAPATVEHRHAPACREGHRVAVGHQ